MAEDRGADAARSTVNAASKGEIATTGVSSLRDLVATQEADIARALPGFMDPGRFVRIVQSELSKNPALKECSPRSFMGAILTAAQLGLEFGPMQQVYAIPFRNHGTMEAQLIIGYRGWLALANRKGEIQSVSAHTVFEKDFFEYEYGLDERCEHRPFRDGDPGKPTHYYCVVRRTNGGRAFVVMTQAEVERHRDRYGKKNGKLVGPWADKDQSEAMSWKTCFLKLKTWIPMSVELMEADHVDGHVVNRLTPEEEPSVSPFDDDDDDDEVVDAEIVDTEETAWDREEREERERTG